jgi:dihydrolipoamide dehydrogenase
LNADIVLVSVGRKPNTSGLNLEKVDIELDEKKRIKTDKNFKTIKIIFMQLEML